MRRARIHPDFAADYVAQLDWLVAHGERAWIEHLADGTERILTTLPTFPEIGAREAHEGTVELRVIRYRKGPYRAWYIYDRDAPAGDIWLVRLFHARQRRRKPDPSRWFPRHTR